MEYEQKAKGKKFGIGRIFLLFVLSLFIFVGFYTYLLFDEFTITDEEVALQQALLLDAEYAVSKAKSDAEWQRQLDQRDREFEERQAQRKLETEQAVQRTRDQHAEIMRQSEADSRAHMLDGISEDVLDDISLRAQIKFHKAGLPPLDPIVLFQLVSIGVKALRLYIKDKIFGNGPQEFIMKQLVHESSIMGDDWPEGDKRLALEKIADSILDWATDIAK